MASELSRLIEAELTSQGFYKDAKSKEQTMDDVEAPHQVLNGKLRVEARVKEQQHQKTLLSFKRSICIGGGVLVVVILCMVLAFKAKSVPAGIVPSGAVASRTNPPPPASHSSTAPDATKSGSGAAASDDDDAGEAKDPSAEQPDAAALSSLDSSPSEGNDGDASKEATEADALGDYSGIGSGGNNSTLSPELSAEEIEEEEIEKEIEEELEGEDYEEGLGEE
ncbi:hypothetical protein Agub_g12985, partial [Astrephomene gubernaculifera]